jgi:2-amino-4-hydroxy-6-hydroxymethyldihydropteridine diphosphokinase
VDYGAAFSEIEKIITGTRRFLIEALALDVGRALCRRFPQIVKASITVRKPNAPVPGVLDHVEVTVVWPAVRFRPGSASVAISAIRRAAMAAALRGLDAERAVAVHAVSSLYRTPPWGMADQPDFLNAVAPSRPTLPPARCLSAASTSSIAQAGAGERWGPRTIDIDLLVFGDARRSTRRAYACRIRAWRNAPSSCCPGRDHPT